MKLDPKEAKAFLDNKEIPEEKTAVERIKAFCKVAYELYLQSAATNDTGNPEKKLDTGPPEKFTNAV